MAVITNDAVFLGNFADADTTEGTGSLRLENTSIYQQTFGSAGAPLYDRVVDMAFNDANNDGRIFVDNYGATETISYDLGSGPVTTRIDSVQRVDLTVTYVNGTTQTLTDVVIFQDQLGNMFLQNSVADSGSLNGPSNLLIESVQVTNVPNLNYAGIDNFSNLEEIAGPVDGTAGNDTIDNTYTDADGDKVSTNADVVYGYGGNDVINAGSGDDTLFGGDGNDTILPGAGADSIDAGAGDDVVWLSDSDSVDGGAGFDTFDATFGAFGETVTFTSATGGATDNGTTFTNMEGFVSGDGADTYDARLATSDLYIQTGSDNDSVTGGSGNDRIDGGLGDDSLAGGSGNDTIFGNIGTDSIDGGFGDDDIFAGAGNDSVTGGAGSDTIQGNGGDDTLSGGGDNDLIYGDTAPGTHIVQGFEFNNNFTTPDVVQLGQFTSLEIDITGNPIEITFLDDDNVLSNDPNSEAFASNDSTQTVLVNGVEHAANIEARITFTGDDGNTYEMAVVQVDLDNDDSADAATSEQGYFLLPIGAVPPPGVNLTQASGDFSSDVNYADLVGYGASGDDVISGGAGDDVIYGDSGGGVPTGPNLITNGSFEDTTGMTPTSYGYVDTGAIVGWTSVDPNGQIDVHNDGRDGINATDGANWLDLEGSGANLRIGQDVAGLTDGDTYRVSFDVNDSPNATTTDGPDENTVNVYWNGELIDTIDPHNMGGDTTWDRYSYDVVAGSGDGTNRLEFEGTGALDNLGASVDNIEMYALGPNPGDGNDTIAGGGGADTIFGEGGDDTILGGGDTATTVGGTNTVGTTYSVIRLGSGPEVDTTEGNFANENSAGLLGTYGGVGNELYNSILEASTTDTNANTRIDFNDEAAPEPIVIDGVSKIVDTGVVYDATVTFTDGSSGTFSAVVIQTTDGDFYLVPEITDNADNTLLTSGLIESITLDAVNVDYTNITAERLDADYAVTAGTDTSADVIYGGAGNDSIDGGGGSDTIYGGAGNDTLDGGLDNDSVYGGTGSDTILLNDGYFGDRIFGGEDVDGLDIDTLDASGVTNGGVDLFIASAESGAVTSSEGTANFSEIERFVLTDQDDTFNGNFSTADLTVEGGAGNDTIREGNGDGTFYGGDGSDTFISGYGTSTIFGGESAGDNDTLDFQTADDTVTITFDGAENGTYFDDDGDSGTFAQIESFNLSEGNDVVDGSLDTAGVTVTGNQGDDSIQGGSGDDVFFGGQGADTLSGGDGVDSLFGGDGSDIIDGGAGDDLVEGGAGADTLTGGIGADTFVVDGAGDTITDFDTTTGIDGGGSDDNDFVDLTGFYNQTNLDTWNANNPGQTYATPLGWLRADQADGTLGEAGNLVIARDNSAVAASELNAENTGVVCFASGTLIRVPGGEVPIETLRCGDLVQTRDNGVKPILWIGQRQLGQAELCAAPNLRPIRLAAGKFGLTRDLVVSPQHGVLLRDPDSGGADILWRARHLSDMQGGAVRTMLGCKNVTYIHMLFDQHELVFSNGIVSESLYPGPMAYQSLSGAAQTELATLFPDLADQPTTKAFGPLIAEYSRRKNLPEHLNALQPTD